MKLNLQLIPIAIWIKNILAWSGPWVPLVPTTTVNPSYSAFHLRSLHPLWFWGLHETPPSGSSFSPAPTTPNSSLFSDISLLQKSLPRPTRGDQTSVLASFSYYRLWLYIYMHAYLINTCLSHKILRFIRQELFCSPYCTFNFRLQHNSWAYGKFAVITSWIHDWTNFFLFCNVSLDVEG